MIYKAIIKNANEYYSNYKLLIQYDYSKKAVLNSNFTHCFLCGRPKEKATFKNESHAVSKLLDSKLMTKDECDLCNKKFGSSYENELGLFLQFFRGIIGTRSYKDSETKIKKEKNETYITTKIKKVDLENLQIHFEISSPERRNIDIYLAILKMSLSVLPRNRKPEIEKAISFLLGDKNLRKIILKSEQFFIWGMNDENCKERNIEIYEQHGQENYPKFLCWIQYERFFFQYYIPFTCTELPYEEELNGIPLKNIIYSSNQNRFIPQTSIEYVNRIVPKGRIENAIKALDPKNFKEFLENF